MILCKGVIQFKVSLVTNHASSYMIMCEAFRTKELVNDEEIIDGIEKIAERLPIENKLAKIKFIKLKAI